MAKKKPKIQHQREIFIFPVQVSPSLSFFSLLMSTTKIPESITKMLESITIASQKVLQVNYIIPK